MKDFPEERAFVVSYVEHGVILFGFHYRRCIVDGLIHSLKYLCIHYVFSISFMNGTYAQVPDILREKVKNNELGRKSGKGFYHWDGEKRGDPVE